MKAVSNNNNKRNGHCNDSGFNNDSDNDDNVISK